jgi:hypothetical protein
MGFFNKKAAEPTTPTPGEITPSDKTSPAETPAAETPANQSRTLLLIQPELPNSVAPKNSNKKGLEHHPVTVLATLLGSIASIGGFIFGYESGQISGMFLILLCFQRKTNMDHRLFGNERFPQPLRRKWAIQCCTTRNNCFTSLCWNTCWLLGKWMDLR